MKKVNNQHYVLHLPKWYPHSDDPQNGSFIRKQILAASENIQSVVLYISPSPEVTGKCKIVSFEKGNFSEHVVLFSKTEKTPKLIAKIRHIPALIMGLRAIRKSFGRPSLVHVHVLLHFGIVALFLKIFYRIPYIITEHWSGYVSGEYASKSMIYRFLCWLVVVKSSCITAVSEVLRKGMISSGFPNRINIVPNVIDPPLTNPKPALPQNRIQMLSVADLVDHIKNISGIILALNEVKTQIPDLDLHIIGDGPDRSNLEQLSRKLDLLDQRVFFHGRKTNKEVYNYYPLCDFVVVNSNYETFSMITAEALAHNKPVIATQCGGPEMFINESNGILIPVGNQTALIDAIKKICGNLNNFKNKDLSAEILSKYSSGQIGSAFIDIYSEIVDLK